MYLKFRIIPAVLFLPHCKLNHGLSSKKYFKVLFKVYSGVIILKDFDSSPLLAEVGQDLSLFCNYQVLITHLSKDV